MTAIEVALRRIIIIDAYPLELEELARLARIAVPDVDVVKAANTATARAELDRNPKFELVLVETDSLGRDTFFVEDCRRNHPEVPISVVSSHFGREAISNAIAEGVVGYLPKTLPIHEIALRWPAW